MGEPLYDEVVGKNGQSRPCRIYAPVGGHEDLLAYLVRRLLENGANTSFVNRLADDEAPVVGDHPRPGRRRPRRSAAAGRAAARLLRPRDIYLPERAAASGLALTEPTVRVELFTQMGDALDDVVRGRAHHRRREARRRRCRQPRHLSARPARAHRHGARHDAGAGRRRDRTRGQRRSTTGTRRAARARAADPRRTPPTCSSATGRASWR